ncbi:MAG: Ion transport 2 domain protein [Deltaproteobacteria bacterium]|nr:Ion transport 2 domain protein [Deltaproteobacteria bacterium]
MRGPERAAVVLTLRRSKFLMLLICLAGLFVVQPMLPRSPGGAAAIHLDVALSLVLLAGIWSISRRTSLLLACVSLISVGLGAAWLARTDGNPTLALVALSCFLGFLIFTVGSVLGHVLAAEEVTTDTILGGVCVYLLLAVVWTLIYGILERLQPGSFATQGNSLFSADDPGALLVPDLVYYSVFTLTTIGPQEIHPLSGPARAWTGIEAMIGQFYVAVLIARLVGLHTSQRRGDT